ncbi:hypothetical protein BDZ45DRAFT_750227 [Acephala macrosclerotiorum]|nr:hypothetical protein BDZ45DRAFT_750227 [Acephala macrosclerotiorum]
MPSFTQLLVAAASVGIVSVVNSTSSTNSTLVGVCATVYVDGLYPAENIEAALEEVFGLDKNILNTKQLSAL